MAWPGGLMNVFTPEIFFFKRPTVVPRIYELLEKWVNWFNRFPRETNIDFWYDMNFSVSQWNLMTSHYVAFKNYSKIRLDFVLDIHNVAFSICYRI